MKTALNKRLETLREEKDWTKRHVSELLSVPYSTYSNWENSNKEPNYKTLINITNLYNVSTDYLLGLSDVREPTDQDKEFMKDITDPNLRRWFYEEIKRTTEEELQQLREMWDIIQRSKNT